MSYEYQPYPAWRHHPDGKSLIVKNEAEDAELGDEWRDSRADFAPEQADEAPPGFASEPEPEAKAEEPKPETAKPARKTPAKRAGGNKKGK